MARRRHASAFCYPSPLRPPPPLCAPRYVQRRSVGEWGGGASVARTGALTSFFLLLFWSYFSPLNTVDWSIQYSNIKPNSQLSTEPSAPPVGPRFPIGRQLYPPSQLDMSRYESFLFVCLFFPKLYSGNWYRGLLMMCVRVCVKGQKIRLFVKLIYCSVSEHEVFFPTPLNF